MHTGATTVLVPGARVAERYLLRRSLGAGGMGHVYEVEHEAIGRRFALKVLRLELSSDEDVRRFQREARALGRVVSPRVAQVIDFGFARGIGPYYVMELLEGETLKDLLDRRGRLSADEVAALGVELCEALHAVHSAGIVHRDLKPSNVGIAHTGPFHVKLLDFGLATSTDGYSLERVTQAAALVGTIPYMAPEQFHDAPLAPEADLYALGVILFEMLSGRLPFTASSTAALIQEHLGAPIPRVADVAPGVVVPAWLEALVRRLLAKDPSARFPSAQALARAFRDGSEVPLAATVASGPPSAPRAAPYSYPAMPPPARRRGLGVAIGVAVALGIGAGAAVYFGAGRGVDDEPNGRTTEALRPEPPSSAPRPAAVAAPAPTALAIPTPKELPVTPVALPPDAAPAPARRSRGRRPLIELPPSASERKGNPKWDGEIIEEPGL